MMAKFIHVDVHKSEDDVIAPRQIVVKAAKFEVYLDAL